MTLIVILLFILCLSFCITNIILLFKLNTRLNRVASTFTEWMDKTNLNIEQISKNELLLKTTMTMIRGRVEKLQSTKHKLNEQRRQIRNEEQSKIKRSI